MITVADPAGQRAHDAYHRFVRDGAWAMSGLWRVLAIHAVARFAPTGVVELLRETRSFDKTGRKVAGAGVFRDAVRSTVARVVYALGLNLVVVAVRTTPPWGGCPIALPVDARPHKKNDSTTTVAHAAAMIREIAGWLPDRELHLCADGAYATLVGADLPRTQVTSRMRRDAALFQGAPPPTGKRGRPRTKGERLPTPPDLAAQAHPQQWKKVRLELRGTTAERLVCVRDVLWYRVNKTDLVRLVIVRDPAGVEPDDFFVTTDLTASGAQVTSRYGRTMADRGVLPRRQTRPRRSKPAVLETPRPRTCRRPIAVAARTGVVLVPPDPPHRPHLDPPPLVPPQEDPELPRRTRRPTSHALVPTNSSHVSLRTRPRQNHRRVTRHPRLRGMNPNDTAKVHHQPRSPKTAPHREADATRPPVDLTRPTAS